MSEDLRNFIIDRQAVVASAVEKTQTVSIKITYEDGRVDEVREYVGQGERVIVCIGRFL